MKTQLIIIQSSIVGIAVCYTFIWYRALVLLLRGKHAVVHSHEGSADGEAN